MKHIKKLASLLLALVMVFALATTAFAEETTYSITINNSTAGHTYEAYQIFTGDLSGTTLSNIKWGSSVSNAASLSDAATVAEKLDTNYTGTDKMTVADLLEMITLGTPAADSGETSNPYVISGLAAGYYLVKDKDGSLTGDNDSYTEYIVKVVGNVTATPKSSVPTVEKKVADTNDSTGVTSGWQDSADYDIGDSVPFQLKATLADNVSSYTTYKVVFHDTLSKGLTYNNDAKVYIGGTETNGFTVTATVNADGTTTLTVSCDDVKALGAGNSSVITVEYTAKLNENAVLGSAGNPNKVYLEYSNNPNKSESGENHETGKTPEDTVIVFTYQTIINKVDSENKPLTGAAFKLEKLIKGKDGAADTWTTVKEFTVDETTTSFTFSGLDDGQYKLTETKTPAGYNTIDPIYFVIEATHDATADTPALTVLKAYLTDENGNKKTEVKDGETVNIDLGTVDLTAGSITTTVVNKSGSELPSTGGIGTTIFYVLGGVLVLAAVVLLVTKKRMSGAEK